MNAIASLGRNVQDDFSEAFMQDQTRKMTEPNLEIRPMTSGELSLAIDWAAREGWNPGLDDAACFAEADRGGFMMAFLDRAPIGCISAVRYDAGFGFIGFYLVRPDLRGKGFGLQVWRTAMSRLEPCTIGLDGVIAQEENYRKSGFALAHRNKSWRHCSVCSHLRFRSDCHYASACRCGYRLRPRLLPRSTFEFSAVLADNQTTPRDGHSGERSGARVRSR